MTGPEGVQLWSFQRKYGAIGLKWLQWCSASDFAARSCKGSAPWQHVPVCLLLDGNGYVQSLESAYSMFMFTLRSSDYKHCEATSCVSVILFTPLEAVIIQRKWCLSSFKNCFWQLWWSSGCKWLHCGCVESVGDCILCICLVWLVCWTVVLQRMKIYWLTYAHTRSGFHRCRGQVPM